MRSEAWRVLGFQLCARPPTIASLDLVFVSMSRCLAVLTVVLKVRLRCGFYSEVGAMMFGMSNSSKVCSRDDDASMLGKTILK